MTVLDTLLPLATEVVGTCTRLRLKIATAESCTGGLIAATLTEVAGSSLVLDRGLVTYSNAAKIDLLAVPAGLIERDGAVSESVARAMAEGALARSGADLAVSVTGIAGPGGGSAEKPVGLVHFAAIRRGGDTVHARHVFPDHGRSAIRLAAVREALMMLRSLTA
jgi:nicotinamide-nucleotide amidase